MKKIVSSLTLVLILVVFVENAYGQGLNVGLNLSGNLPAGDNTDMLHPGVGGNLSIDFYFSKKLNVGFEIGYQSFDYDSDLDIFKDENISVVPILLTGAVHKDISEKVDFYSELGAGIYTTWSGIPGGSSKTNGGLSPRLGFAFKLNSDLFFDTNLNYNHIFSDGSDLNWFGLNVGVLYSLSNLE